jgi:tryptophanyl-tRNA synthetase
VNRVLSGITITGEIHLGNYLGAVRWWVEDQHGGDAYYFLADLHALTVPGDPAELHRSTLTMATVLIAAGLDPAACTLFAQSHVPQHTQLTWLLECTAGFGELRRMTQFKDKAAKGGEETARAGLFTYPVLMAADILLYDADRVPVGDDQRQHLELTRTLAERFNTRYGPTFVVPEAKIPPPGRGARIMDLQEPTMKMSKTATSTQGTIFLLDEPATIERKVRRAVTDTDSSDDAVRYDPDDKPGVSGLVELLATATGREPAEVATGYSRYGPLKADTAEAVVELVRPIQQRYRELADDPGAVVDVLRVGAAKAEAVASVTYARARDAIGLLAPGPA